MFWSSLKGRFFPQARARAQKGPAASGPSRLSAAEGSGSFCPVLFPRSQNLPGRSPGPRGVPVPGTVQRQEIICPVPFAREDDLVVVGRHVIPVIGERGAFRAEFAVQDARGEASRAADAKRRAQRGEEEIADECLFRGHVIAPYDCVAVILYHNNSNKQPK